MLEDISKIKKDISEMKGMLQTIIATLNTITKLIIEIKQENAMLKIQLATD